MSQTKENIELAEKQPLKDENHNEPLEEGETNNKTNKLCRIALIVVSISLLSLVAFLFFQNSAATGRVDTQSSDEITSDLTTTNCNLNSILQNYASASLSLLDHNITSNTKRVNSFTELNDIYVKFDNESEDYSYKSMFLGNNTSGVVEMFLKARAVNTTLKIMYGKMSTYDLIGSKATKIPKSNGGQYKKITTDRTLSRTSRFDYDGKDVLEFCSFGLSNKDPTVKVCYASQMGFCALMSQNEQDVDIVISTIIRVNSDEKQLADIYKKTVRDFDNLLLELSLLDDTEIKLPEKTTTESSFDRILSYGEVMEELNTCFLRAEKPTKQFCFRERTFIKPTVTVQEVQPRNPNISALNEDGEEYQEFNLNLEAEKDDDEYDYY